MTSVFFTLFIGIQFYAWVFVPEYNQSLSTTYLSRDSVEPYTVPFSLFLPTFVIINEADMSYNDESLFDFGFRQQIDRGETVDIPAIPCSEWMERDTSLTDQEKDALKAEMMQYDHLLCPDAESLTVKG